MKSKLILLGFAVVATAFLIAKPPKFVRDYKFNARKRELIKTYNLDTGDPVETAKKLNAFVYSFCDGNAPQVQGRELVWGCHTNCRGYVQVFEYLAKNLGLHTRVMHLTNIPQQNSHALVEVELAPGEWSLFDPTFGAFFEEPNKAAPMSMEAVRAGGFSYEDFEKKAMQVSDATRAQLPQLPGRSAKDLYVKGRYQAANMNLSNYLIAEAAGPLDASRPLVLTMYAKVDAKGEYSFGSDQEDLARAEGEFVEQSNRSIGDEDKMNDVPAVFFRLGYEEFSAFHQRVIHVRAFEPHGDTATLILSGYAEKAETILASGLGRDFDVRPAAVQVGPGWFKKEFVMRENGGTDGFVFLTPPVNSKVSIRIYSFKVVDGYPQH